MMDNKENTDQEPNQLEVQRMPVILSYPDLCESGCSFRCDDPLSFTEIQFVLPNGEKHNQLFTAKTTIQEVKEYVMENIRLPFGDFTLSTTSPQFDFRAEHFATSLGGFGLVPFTVLTVRPDIHIFDQLENMPVLQSHPGLCGTACPYRCDDPLSFAEIEFRLPGGATHTHCFTARTTIQQVKEYVQANLELPFGDFTLSTVSPQFIFTAEHFSITLGGLGLVPQSILLIRPNMQVRHTTFTAVVTIMGSVLQVLIF